MSRRQVTFFIPLLVWFLSGSVLIERCRAAEPTIDELKADLKDPKVKVRKKAATELGKTKSLDAVPPLLSAATDPDPGVREAVVESLGMLKDQSAITMLLTTLRDPVEEVRSKSIVALVTLYLDRDAEFVITRVSKKVYKTVNPFSDQVGHDPSVIEAYIKVSPSVIDGMSERLVDSSSKIRVQAAKALGVLRGRAAIPKLLDGMKTGDVDLKIATLRSFSKIKDPSVDAALLPYLKDSNQDVRVETIVTLGLLRSKKALPEIQSVYDQNPDTKLRLVAFQAIAMIGDPSSLDLFKTKLKDPDKPYRIAAAEGISRVGDSSVTEDVSRAYIKEKEYGCQLAMSFALYRLGRPEYFEKMLSALNETYYHEQVEAYFIEIGSPVVPELVKNLTSSVADVRIRLCLVLGLIGDSSAIDSLKPLLKDTNSSVVSEAAVAIRRLNASR
ncbi:MAG: HEAT repeat domain-containing protein [Terriglobia bacterium]